MNKDEKKNLQSPNRNTPPTPIMQPTPAIPQKRDKPHDLISIHHSGAGRLQSQSGEADLEEKLVQRAVAEGIKDAEEDEGRAGGDGGEDGEERDYAEGFGGVEVFIVVVVVFVGVVIVVVVVGSSRSCGCVFVLVIVVVATCALLRLLLPTYTLIAMIMTLILQQGKPRLVAHHMHGGNGNHEANAGYRRTDQEQRFQFKRRDIRDEPNAVAS